MGLKAVSVCCFLFLSLHSFCQSPAPEVASTTLTGIVLDSAGLQPIEYATISLFKQGDTKTVNGALSNAQGKFKMEVAQAGIYDLLIESIGYQSYTLKGVRIESNTHKSLDKIYLNKKITRLADVTVIEPQNLSENK